jgi:hypothetical protein
MQKKILHKKELTRVWNLWRKLIHYELQGRTSKKTRKNGTNFVGWKGKEKGT